MLAFEPTQSSCIALRGSKSFPLSCHHPPIPVYSVQELTGSTSRGTMRLSLQTDYALRTLLFLATRTGRTTVADVAEFFGISAHHVGKVVHQLGRLGYVTNHRGPSGGIALAREPTRDHRRPCRARFRGEYAPPRLRRRSGAVRDPTGVHPPWGAGRGGTTPDGLPQQRQPGSPPADSPGSRDIQGLIGRVAPSGGVVVRPSPSWRKWKVDMSLHQRSLLY